MTPYATAQTGTYLQQAVLTATPGRLVVMLYDGALRFLFQAATAMREGANAQADDRIGRAEAIVNELMITLDMSHGEIPSRLQGIYAFCNRLMIEATLERNPDKLDTTHELLSELREAWAEIAGT
jgi:flagellar protein FliS